MRTTTTLEDKYELPRGRVYMTGTQALVRLLLAQKTRDEAAGLNTEGFVSGYRGSPLGALDQELWKNQKRLAARKVRFEPGLNEELAATSVWGTQMLHLDAKARVDGVFSLWYGKGPGVDRSGDVFKHGNIAGCSPKGGVLLIAGDDHACKSSSLPHQSEHAFIAAMIPVLHPAGVSEFIEYGLHGYAMSRYSGCWVGFKVVSETVESSSSVDIDPMAVEVRLPDSYPIPEGGFSIRWPDPPLEQENRLQRERLYALLEYVRLNKLNRESWVTPNARIGICTAGKSYLDVREALTMLGIDDDKAQALGIRLLKIGVVWPLEPECVQSFAEGLEEILVVEEKRQILEYQIKEHLYNDARRPRVVGKFDESGEWVKVPSHGILLSPNGELTPAQVADAIASRLLKVLGRDALPARTLDWLERDAPCGHKAGAGTPQRLPYFCSGCPHNISTKVPEGSRALAGIGCHYMSMWMDRRTETFSQMGGEGVPWIGQAPFTDTHHVFANLGDGTYMHSGSLAIRASLAAKVNITYKLLVNDAVAMTGGQPVEGAPSVEQLLHQLHAEGVRALHLVSDEPDLYGAGLPPGVEIHHRQAMDGLQRRLRDTPGVSVIVYAQTCAAEKRRRRKKKLLIDPPKRVVINEAVCEGCGDCGVASNCVSILPLETPLGRKRTIDQNACNKDFSCTQGFCPSFVTLEGATLRRPNPQKATPPSNLPAPPTLSLERPYNILVGGIGGTGVVTIGALMGMAAHLEGKGVMVLDVAGLAQKGGAVLSHVRLGANPAQLHGARVSAGQADLILGCDLLVAAGKEALEAMAVGNANAVLNLDVSPTGEFTQQPDWNANLEQMVAAVTQRALTTQTLEASRIATALMGDAVATNVFLLGFAWQCGWVPLAEASLLRAIELNGAAVPMNTAAFHWGRAAAVDLEQVKRSAGLTKANVVQWLPQKKQTLDALIEDRVGRLSAYQNRAYAERFEAFVRKVAHAEHKHTHSDTLALDVATSLYKLMAYKDEYEVARLYTQTDFLQKLRTDYDGDFKLRLHLAPPLWTRRDEGGTPIKQTYGPWMLTAMKALAQLRWVRGTPLDIFGYTAERRDERAAIGAFISVIESLLADLGPHNLDAARRIARLPQSVRGFGHVRERNAKAQAAELERLLAMWQSTSGQIPLAA